jgi:4-amino-4-deoxy-L-arabinose transferase-like glycosyltransferase
LKANRWLLVVLALALLVRILYVGYYYSMPDWDQLTVDNYYHHHWAQSIAGGNIFGDTTYFRAPFYVYCLALLYALFGTSLWVSRIFGILLGLTSVAMTYLTGKRIFSAKIGLTAALLQSLYPVMIYFEGELLLDPLFTLLLQLAVYRLVIWFDNKTTGQVLATGLLLGLASITRPTALVFIPLIVLLLAAALKNAGAWAKHSMIFILAVSLVIAPIFVRNLVVAGDPVTIASQGGINLYIGNNSNADGVSAVLPEPLGHNWRLREITYLAEQEVGKRLKPGDVSSYWTKKALHWMRNNPGQFIELYVKKLYRNFSNREISNNRDLNSFFNNVPILKYNPLSFGLLFTLVIVGVMAGLGRHSHVGLLLLVVIVYILAASLFFFNSRFRLPLLPYYFLLAAFGLFSLIDRLRSKWRAGVPLLFGAGCAALFSFYPFIPLPRGGSTLSLTSKGLYYYTNKDFQRAIYYHRLALSIDSTFPETNLNLGACYFKLGMADSAGYYFEREKRLNPNRTKAYTNIASLHLVNGRYAEAITEAKQALARKPYDVMANMVLLRAASAIQKINNDSLANMAFRATDNTGDDIYLLNDAAGLLTGRGDLLVAESLLTRALNSKPPPIETDDEAFAPTFRNSFLKWEKERARTNYQLGYVYGLQGRYRDATRHSSIAIQGDSNLIEAYINLVSGLLSSGQRRQADSVLAVALAKFPTNQHLHQLGHYLEK